MALFSRRKKSVDQPDVETEAPVDDAIAQTDGVPEAPAESVPTVGISVQAFRGVGAEAGPEVSAPVESGTDAGEAADEGIQVPRPASGAPVIAEEQMGGPRLPLAPALPPE